jgi:multiple sugar transport system ATP-binding protein
MARVDIENVVKSYGSMQVVHGVSTAIEDGEFVILVGPSGCGKSTLLRMIAGLEHISDGTISIDGEVVNDVAPKDRNIAMVFQNYALYPHMTVAQNMAFSLKLAGVGKDEMRSKVDNAARILGWKNCSSVFRAAIRRPAPARRHGPRHRARSGGLPVRRAALQS